MECIFYTRYQYLHKDQRKTFHPTEPHPGSWKGLGHFPVNPSLWSLMWLCPHVNNTYPLKSQGFLQNTFVSPQKTESGELEPRYAHVKVAWAQF